LVSWSCGVESAALDQDREGRFSIELLERYQRSERALVAALAEMCVQGVSTRKVKGITEEMCGHAFSASAVSAIVKRLDGSWRSLPAGGLARPFPISSSTLSRVGATAPG
jgi:transposase-like protein